MVFIDWRGIEKVITAATAVGLELINVCVWYKGQGSFGSPWRSAHELLAVFRVPGKPIKDRVKMGKHGRVRQNVFEAPGMGSFGKGRMQALAMHPCCKPQLLLKELIRDVTDRGDLILDTFSDASSVLMAGERTGRIVAAMELDPLYVDTSLRRWEQAGGEPPVLEGDGRTFAEIEAARAPKRLAKVRERRRITEPEDPADDDAMAGEDELGDELDDNGDDHDE